ncbi:MAG: AraC family transcriptional regulator ligand-binding domain-containing protein [Kofleriaceae bacterium]
MDLPAAYIRDVVDLVARWNVTPEALLAGLPITREDLASPATRVPLQVCGELIARAHRLTSEPALAVYLGMQMRLSSHGFLGFAAMTAGTVREAIELAVRFASTRTTLLGLSFHVEDRVASIVIDAPATLGPFREFAVVGLAVGLWQLGEGLTGRKLDGVVEVSFPAPDYLVQLPLAGRIRFSCPVDRLVFPAELLALSLVTADPLATQLARVECERELAALVHAGLPGRVRAALAEDPNASLLAIAKRLHVSTRTLKRHLAEHATSFSTIAGDVRRQRAFLLLDNRTLSIGEVATRLGYTELPNFTRAFRKWTGMTPATYRARR